MICNGVVDDWGAEQSISSIPRGAWVRVEHAVLCSLLQKLIQVLTAEKSTRGPMMVGMTSDDDIGATSDELRLLVREGEEGTQNQKLPLCNLYGLTYFPSIVTIKQWIS